MAGAAAAGGPATVEGGRLGAGVAVVVRAAAAAAAAAAAVVAEADASLGPVDG